MGNSHSHPHEHHNSAFEGGRGYLPRNSIGEVDPYDDAQRVVVDIRGADLQGDDTYQVFVRRQPAAPHELTGAMRGQALTGAVQDLSGALSPFMSGLDPTSAGLPGLFKSPSQGNNLDQANNTNRSAWQGVTNGSKPDSTSSTEQSQSRSLTEELSTCVQRSRHRQQQQGKDQQDSSQTGWDSISGLDSVKQLLQEATVLPSLRPDLFTGIRQPPRGILLFGPPGSGKTMLARAVANESGAAFFAITGSNVLSMWYGQSEANVRALFEKARQQQPSVIFIDEVDSLLGKRGGGGGGPGGETGSSPDRKVTNEFLSFIDGIQTQGQDSRVIVMAATNHPWDLDEAALSRFARRVYVPLPERTARADMLRRAMKGVATDINSSQYLQLAEKCAKYSGRDIMVLCREAAMRPLRELWGGSKIISRGDEAADPAAGKRPKEALQKKVVQILEGRLKESRTSRRLKQVRRELAVWVAKHKSALPEECTADLLVDQALEAFQEKVDMTPAQGSAPSLGDLTSDDQSPSRQNTLAESSAPGKPDEHTHNDQTGRSTSQPRKDKSLDDGRHVSDGKASGVTITLDELVELPADKVRPVSMADFETALKQIMPSEMHLTQQHEEFNQRYGSGADVKTSQNAAHFLMYS